MEAWDPGPPVLVCGKKDPPLDLAIKMLKKRVEANPSIPRVNRESTEARTDAYRFGFV